MAPNQMCRSLGRPEVGDGLLGCPVVDGLRVGQHGAAVLSSVGGRSLAERDEVALGPREVGFGGRDEGLLLGLCGVDVASQGLDQEVQRTRSQGAGRETDSVPQLADRHEEWILPHVRRASHDRWG